jgi:dedicator of cytokinesis protein 6/7/8
VKDDGKYGRYESVAPPSFQNQIFEGPDTDIETGNPSSLWLNA